MATARSRGDGTNGDRPLPGEQAMEFSHQTINLQRGLLI
jgi:hypothetical protein